MSNKAIDWAISQPIKPSGAKFILMMYANCADERLVAWPSGAYLEWATGQDRKTVLGHIKRLRELGYIEDTGERKGDTKQVVVYRLKSPDNGTVTSAESGQPASVQQPENDPENGTVKESQNRNSTENGTVPFFPANSTVFPGKQSQNSLETVPKTGHGTIKEPSKEPSGNHQARAKQQPIDTFILPDWIPIDAWNGFLDMRRGKKKVPTVRARDLIIKELAKLRTAGHDVGAVLDQSTRNGWTDVFPLKDSDKRGKAADEGSGQTLRDFIESNKAAGNRVLPEEDPIFEYASTVGLPEDAVAIAWFKFKERYLNSADRQSDWREHFRKAVKDNWYKLWYLGSDGTSGWTTAGQQALREFDAKQKVAA